MHKNLIGIALLSLLGGSTISACGGSTYDNNLTCNVPQNSVCEQYKTTSEADAAEVRDACTQGGGQLILDPCPTANLLGKCHLKDKQADLVIFIYPSSVVTTTEGAKAGCDNLRGSFSKP